MTSVILAEPSVIGLSGLWVVGLLLLGVMLSAAVYLIVHFSRRTKREFPLPAIPPAPPCSRICPQCGAELKPDVPEGLCPACLLKHGIATEPGAQSGQAPFVPPDLAELARLFPQMEIIEAIGKGGMGAVYKARQPALDRVVALKILAPKGPAGGLDFAGRFTREARALARLNHPNIVAVYDFGQVQTAATPLHYFIMEYVDGPNLRQVQQAGRVAPREALQIIPQICAALQFAHDEGIVHRDIKPENVLLDKKGRVKIADFGLAMILGSEPPDFRLTGAKDVMGTPHYMAPEQVEKPQEVDHRADIYSLGVVFYEMLTGELPLGKFPSPSAKVQVDVRLDEVVLRSLEKEPARRYQHVSEMKTQVETIAAGPQSSKPEIDQGATGNNWLGAIQPLLFHAAILLILSVVLGKVVPTFADIFAGFGVKPSRGTLLAVNLSSLFRHWWPLLVPLLLALDFGGCVLAQRFGGNQGRKLWSIVVVLVLLLTLALPVATLGKTYFEDLPRAAAEGGKREGAIPASPAGTALAQNTPAITPQPTSTEIASPKPEAAGSPPVTNAPPASMSPAELAERFTAAQGIFSFAERDRAMATLALDAAKAGNPATTRKALAKITAYATQDDATHHVVRELVKQGRRTEALEIARTITSFTRRDAVLREMAK